MIHKFLKALEKYGYTMFYQKHSEAEQALLDGYNKILRDIEEYQLSQPDSLKQYVIGLYDSIIVYRQRNLYQRNELEIKFNEDKSKLTNLEATEHDLKVDYLKTIYNYILDAEFYLVEYLTETGNTRNMFQSHYQLYNALIFASNESEEQPISGAVEILTKVWFFINSDNATFNGKIIKKVDRPIFVNPVLIGKANFDQFFKAEIWFDSKMNNIKLTEHDFINDIADWVELQINSNTKHSATRLRKYNEFLDFLKNKYNNPNPIIKEPKENPFSVLEWATIFYYANETKLLKESPTVVGKLKEFMSEHEIVTTFKGFKNVYYTAIRRINQKNDYPIEKLEKIIPFLKENYKQSVTKVENDITILEDYKTDN